MTKITNDFVGTENTAVTKQRLTDILAYWGASTAGYTTWGQARSALNTRLLNTTAGVIGSEELAGSFLPKINFLNDPDAMILTALFGAGEQGVWFDPSDVANVAWRRNLLLQTEGFGNALWYDLSTGTTTKTIGQTDPLGGTTAVKLVGNNASTWLGQGIGPISGGPYTFSVWLRSDSAASATLILSYGPGDNTQIVSLTTAWQRFSVTGVRSATAGLFGVINIGNGVPVYAWGAQLEAGSLTEYQRITDLNNEIITRFPDATMFQDHRGTIPVYAPNQPVGLRLDKSKALALGPELVANGDFSSGTTGWITSAATIAVVGGQAELTSTASGSFQVNYQIASTVGKTFKMTATLRRGTSTGSVGFGLNGVDAVVTSNTSDTPITLYLVTNASPTINVQIFSTGASAGSTIYFDNVSVREILGNHARQSTDISRPLYGIEPAGGRRNLLTYTEDFTNAAWTKQAGTTVTANQTTAPDGTATADLAVGNGTSGIVLTGIAVSTTAANTKSIYLRGVSGGEVVQLKDPNFTLATITCNLTTSWQRFSLSEIQTGGLAGVWVANIPAGGIFIWGAQLEVNSTVTPYQKVVSDYEVTEAGVQTCHYCNYDGTNDGMLTNSIDFTATDKMSVFAAVRKTSDTFGAIVVETSVGNANGSWRMYAGDSGSASGPYWTFGASGTANSQVTTAATFPAPRTNLVTGLADISGDRTTLRVNSVQIGQSTLDLGTGNFGNYPMYIGRRNNATLPLNGRDYGIIVTGKLATSTQIGNAENFLLNKLGSLAPVITGVPTIGVN